MNAAILFSLGKFLRDFQQRQVALPAHHRVNIVFLQRLPRNQARMPTSKNNRQAQPFLLYCLSNPHRPANHWSRQHRNAQA